MVMDCKTKNIDLYQHGNPEPYQCITDLRICNIQIKIWTGIRIKRKNESGKIPAKGAD